MHILSHFIPRRSEDAHKRYNRHEESNNRAMDVFCRVLEQVRPHDHPAFKKDIATQPQPEGVWWEKLIDELPRVRERYNESKHHEYGNSNTCKSAVKHMLVFLSWLLVSLYQCHSVTIISRVLTSGTWHGPCGFGMYR